MTEKAKKRVMIENVAEKFLLLPESDKSFIAGYLTGKDEERAKWEKKQKQTETAQRQQEMPCRMRQGVNITEVQA